MEREYIVSLNRDVDYDQFWTEMETTTTGHPTVPERAVDIVNARPLSLRNCHYALTDEEADRLRTDPRVYGVEIPPDQRDDIEIGLTAVQTGVFDKSTNLTAGQLNWGLLRSNAATNVFGLNTQLTDPYNYMLDGTGVDVVIQDSGIQADHPEFRNYAGTASRVQQINWYTASGLPGTQVPGHYLDTHGHGTHVASTAVGLRHGWAKNAAIYSVKVNGLEGGNGDSGTGIVINDCFDVIKGWHLNKPIDPVTGVRRPTIVNMSWGYGRSWGAITGGVYRGTPWTGTSVRTDFGMIGRNGRHPVLIPSVEVDMQELLDAGVHVAKAASNDSQKVDIPGGLDYDNYYISGGTNIYYHRGSSPQGDGRALCVGALDSATFSSSLDRKVNFSNSGPAVNIFAPGTNIQSATSTTTVFTTIDYPQTGPAPTTTRYDAGTQGLYVYSNSYICQKTAGTYSNYTKSVLGAHMLLGTEVWPTQSDAATSALYGGTVEGGDAYRIRFQGYSDFNNTSKILTWEVTFWRDNSIEILMIRHDDASAFGTQFGLFDEDTSSSAADASLSYFKTPDLLGASAVPRSVVLTTSDGLTWNEFNNSRIVKVGNVITRQEGAAIEKGLFGLVPIDIAGDETGVRVILPFTFYFFNDPGFASSVKEARISGTSMASPQVCGVGACLLQLRPGLTPTQLRDLVISYSTPTVYTTGLNNDYTNLNTIHGAPVRVLRNPFGKAADTFSGQFRNGLQFRRR